MKKLALLTLLPLTLGSCGLFGTPKTYAVSGTISGTQPSGNVKMAVLGVSASGVVNANVGQIAIPTFDNNTKKFSVDYPSNPADGVYQVIAYIDANGDSKYNVGETRTKNNNMYLVYSKSGGTVETLLGIKAGWNLVQGTTVTQPGTITNYDLSW